MSETTAPSPATSTAAGTFVWNELNTNDLPAAGKFYTDLFGWGMDHYSGGGMTSAMFKVGGKHVGGMVDNPDPNGAPFWLCYVNVNDLAATCARVLELGGKIVIPPTKVPNVGSIAVLQDKQGAYLGMFQA